MTNQEIKDAIIITITGGAIRTIDGNFYDYSGPGQDRILENKFNGDYEVFYSGQNQGRMDQQLLDAVNASSTFRVYYRIKSNSPFTFLGSTTSSSIVQERITVKGINALPTERLQIRLVIPRVNIENTQIPNNDLFAGVGCYKKSVLQHSNFPTNLNVNLGFYTRPL